MFCLSTGLSIKAKNGKVVLSVPNWVYDLTQKILTIPNTLEGWLCHLQPSNSVWNERDVNVKVKPSGESLEQVKNDLTEKKDRSYHEEDLVLLYDSLPVVGKKKKQSFLNTTILLCTIMLNYFYISLKYESVL